MELVMRWEYKTVKVKRRFLTGAIDIEEFQTQLNDLGRDGWEFVTINQYQGHGVVAVPKRSLK